MKSFGTPACGGTRRTCGRVPGTVRELPHFTIREEGVPPGPAGFGRIDGRIKNRNNRLHNARVQGFRRKEGIIQEETAEYESRDASVPLSAAAFRTISKECSGRDSG